MKVTAVSDIHGNMKMVMSIISISKPDLLLSCGDWGDKGEAVLEDYEKIIAVVPLLTVYGNHDDLELLSQIRNSDGSMALLTPGTVTEMGGLTFTGINGIWAKSHRKPYYVTDEEVASYAKEVSGMDVDIFMTHGCPIGLADTTPGGRRGGQRCFLDAFHLIHPRLYLCGHLHTAQKRVLGDGRIVVNTGHTREGDYWTFEISRDVLSFDRHRLI